MFDKIANDPYIIELYRKIDVYEDATGGEGHHNYNHVTNVAKTIETVLKQLGYNDEYIDDAKIAAILHDTGCVEGKNSHPVRSRAFSKEYFDSNNIHLQNEDLILEAILNHSDGFNADNMMTLVLIFADKLDNKNTRLSKAGYNNVGARQMQYINDIIVKIDKDLLTVNFMTDKEFNVEEYMAWEFFKKIFKSIESFSNKLELKHIVYLNGQEWNLK